MINGVILAGGLSRRMGTDKGLLQFSGVTMVEHVYKKLAPLCERVIVVTNRPEAYELVVNHLPLQIITDEIKQMGPYSGIHAALGVTDTDYNIVLACDMPYANPAWFIDKSEKAMEQGYDLIIARTVDGRLQPLHAIYHKNCRTTMEELLRQEKRKLSELTQHVKAEIIVFDEKHEEMFYNMNTPVEYKSINEWNKN